MGARPPVTPRRTYWHLEGGERTPSEYEVATSRLLYYRDRGFEVSAPLAAWYREHQQGSALVFPDPEGFRDPRETTYASYVALQDAQESRVDEVLLRAEQSAHDGALSSAGLTALDRILPVLRYPMHGLQMLACYVGHMAPGGRVVVTCALQAADEIRRIQRIAYRMRQLAEVHASFGADAARAWQHEPAFQPLRELVERMLVTYDWGEAFVALNLAVKPVLDELFMVRVALLARAQGDEVSHEVLTLLCEDCRWHEAWARALLRVILAQEPKNSAVVSRWLETWQARAREAVQALEPLVRPGERSNVR